MKINVNVVSADISVQIIDAFYAYIQSGLNERIADWDIDITNTHNDAADVNIIWANKDTTVNINANYYDIVVISNAGEPVTVSSSLIHNIWQNNNVFLVFNSLLTQDHSLYNKVIPFLDAAQQCRDYWTRYFYPHYHIANKLKKIQRSKDLIAINGLNRTVRHYFFKLLNEKTNIKILKNISTDIVNTNHSYWETKEDFEFRNYLEEQYSNVFEPEPDYKYYDNAKHIGINNKFGKINPGYELLPEYFEYRCIIFPESSWQNNELALTEKALKCFYAGSLPFPIAGANVNSLYNSLGFATAWNLLPKYLQCFDSEQDHFKRIEQQINALKWFEDNAMVFQTAQYTELTRQNMINMLTYSPIEFGIQKLIRIIDERRRRH